MFDRRTGKLDIFENFRIDFELPKYKPIPEDSEESMSEQKDSSGFKMQKSNVVWGVMEENSVMVTGEKQSPRSWFSRLVSRMKIKREPRPTMTVEQFFKSVKNSASELKVIAQRAEGYAAAMDRAKAGGQKALVEQLSGGLAAVRSETQLLAVGLIQYLDEDTLISFVKKATKGLRLDWVANFTRVIPDELLKRKKDLDERQVFDNYVVLHYDPKAKSWAETEAEKAKRKDPILFGVMQGRRRLYYVGDWIDEFCNLTLDQVADTLGQTAIKAIDQKVFE